MSSALKMAIDRRISRLAARHPKDRAKDHDAARVLAGDARANLFEQLQKVAPALSDIMKKSAAAEVVEAANAPTSRNAHTRTATARVERGHKRPTTRHQKAAQKTL